jgi:polysaccharide export outer membrane protein
MKKQSDLKRNQNFAARKCRLTFWTMLPVALIAAAMFSGCATQSSSPNGALEETLKGQATNSDASTTVSPELITLREGDVVKVSFPGSSALDTTQLIRRDGRITLPLIGEVDAAGLTPPALEKKLVDLYAPQLASKQVTVEVISSSFPVYVTGMVLHPGKILSDHPITALEAVMEAGGFDYNTANPRDVVVIRREGNVMKNYKINLKAVLQGKASEPFYMKPGDIIYVPERFNVF